MQKMITRLIVISVSGFAAGAMSATTFAADVMKPGLWSISVKSDAITKMPTLSPEQLEQMRKMGINMPQMQAGAIVQKLCVTKEMASRNQMPDMHQDQLGCQTKNASRTASGYSADIVCSGPQLKGNGTMKASSAGDGSFRSVNDFKGESQGRPVSHHQESTSTWISAECGDVKPLPYMGAKK